MKVLVLHLSDIHIRTPGDVILGRTRNIVDAVKNLESEIGAVVCVLSGDIAYSGAEDEYLLALDFVANLRKGLLKALPTGATVSFVAVPGNHDCDFKEATDARTFLMQAVRAEPSRLADPSFADVCLAPQRRFFQFVTAIDHVKRADDKSPDRRLYAEFRLDLDGQTMLFCCCNSAALSSMHEQPGTLAFPVDVIRSSKMEAVVSVGILHHPYNWMQPETARALRDRLGAISDFVLTGHEHVLDKSDVSRPDTDNTFLEGGVLQDSGDPDTSEFHVLLVDMTMRKQRLVQFSWNGNAYEPSDRETPEAYHAWEDFVPNRARQQEAFQLLPKFRDHLDDPELTLVHRRRGTLRLSDIYVFPDLKRLNLTGEKGTFIVSGERVLDSAIEKLCLFIVGDDVGGKTSLAKRLFHFFHGRSDVPILVNGTQDTLSPGSCEIDLEKCFLRNYVSSALADYRRLDRSRRVVIIDNYHKLRLEGRAKVELMRKLKLICHRVIVFANDLEVTFQDFSDAGASGGSATVFAYYSIMPFSLLRRNKLVEKWLLLGGDADCNTCEFAHNLEALTRIIDTLVGKNYVPAYPSYVLAVLQATEAGTDIDLHASTHGYLYELFIKSAIAKGGSAQSFNIVCTYLAHIAHWMFTNRRTHITESELRHLHEQLHEKYEVLADFSRQTNSLKEMQLMYQRNDSFSFQHRYIYYYFLAFYLRDRLQEPAIVAAVQQMASQLHSEESSNTLLFLAHLSKDRMILTTLLERADVQYHGVQQAELAEDVKFLNQMYSAVGKIKLPNVPIAKSRQEFIGEMDVARQEETVFEEARRSELEDANTLLGRLNAALKTIQILGQILKNFPADLDRNEKDRIIAACTGLGRRALAHFLSLVRENETQLLEEMATLIGRKKAGIEIQKLRERAAGAVRSVCELAALGIITRLSYALGSRELAPTYERLFPHLPEPFMRLLYLALQLDQYDDFPEGFLTELVDCVRKNPFAFQLARSLVYRYLALFPTDFRLKQRLSDSMDFEFKAVVNSRRERLLKEKN